MALVQRKRTGDPTAWGALNNLHRELEKLMERFDYDWNSLGRAWQPPMDVVETESEYVLEAEVPGVEARDIHLEAADNTITVRGQRKDLQRGKETNVYRAESSYGKFQRTVEVRGFDHERVVAELRDGILRVTLPKRENAKPRRIELNAN